MNAGEELRANAMELVLRRWAPRLLPWSEIDAIMVFYRKGVPHISLILHKPEDWRQPGLVGTANQVARWGANEFTISTDLMDRSFPEVRDAIDRYYPKGVIDPMKPGS
jgi:hypothetical protein